MRPINLVHVVSCHAEGEVGDVIVGGVAPPPGESIWQQARWIAKDQYLRSLMLNEPRGGVFRHVNLLVPPKSKGKMALRDRLIGRSIIGGRFECAIESEAMIGEKRAIIPSISGRAWITGTHQHMLDGSDPWPGGYKLSDTWPMLNKSEEIIVPTAVERLS